MLYIKNKHDMCDSAGSLLAYTAVEDILGIIRETGRQSGK